jgi:hypothetical protein
MNLLSKTVMIKKFAFIAVAKTRKKMDNFEANSDNKENRQNESKIKQIEYEIQRIS